MATSSKVIILDEVDFLTGLEGLLRDDYDALFGPGGGVINLDDKGILFYASRRNPHLTGIVFSANDYRATWRTVMFDDPDHWYANLTARPPDPMLASVNL